MIRLKISACLLCASLLAGCLSVMQGKSYFLGFPAYKGRVIDFFTKQPLPNVMIFIAWKEKNPSTANEGDRMARVVQAKTGPDGTFSLEKGRYASLNPLSYVEPARGIVFLPGYEIYGIMDDTATPCVGRGPSPIYFGPENGSMTIELMKLDDPLRRQQNLACARYYLPDVNDPRNREMLSAFTAEENTVNIAVKKARQPSFVTQDRE